MPEIKKLALRNFWSWGDYETVLELDNLGPCLISGGVDSEFGKISNGAGKSSLLESILWCLFGRTMRNSNPGDKIVNFFTKKDCYVELTFKNGDVLRRTRNVDGHNDLLFIRDGQDMSLGTSRMEQARLNRLLGLDFDIFTGSTFFSQFGKSWMEISDTRRKEALEREFRLDRMQIYVSVAKSRLDRAKQEQDHINVQLDALAAQLSDVKQQIEKFNAALEKFDEQKQSRIANVQRMLDEVAKQQEEIEIVDVDALGRRWDLHAQIEQKLEQKQGEIYAFERQRRKLVGDKDHHQALISKWEGKGEICGSCEQPIPADYVAKKIGTPREKLALINEQIDDLDAKIAQSRDAATQIAKIVNDKKPVLTVSQAEAAVREHQRCSQRMEQFRRNIKSISDEQNEYAQTIEDLKAKADSIVKKIDEATKRLSKFDKLILHLNYIYRAYSDRRKIKSYMLAEYVPYLNSRIKYYLVKFGLDLSIEFTNALGIKTDQWGYDQFSGGECKRFDVAMMLAMFDLHTLMYGRHCNLIVFDEVDGRLDVGGAEMFAEIIRSDFADKVDTVLVISQRVDMRQSLPSEIRVVREDRFSKISEILR